MVIARTSLRAPNTSWWWRRSKPRGSSMPKERIMRLSVIYYGETFRYLFALYSVFRPARHFSLASVVSSIFLRFFLDFSCWSIKSAKKILKISCYCSGVSELVLSEFCGFKRGSTGVRGNAPEVRDLDFLWTYTAVFISPLVTSATS